MQTPAFFSREQVLLETATYPTANLIGLVDLPSTKVYFLDVNARLGEDSSDPLVAEDEAIKGQIRNILSTPLGSEPFEPEYGSMWPYRLFEPVTAFNAWNLENDTIVAVNRWMKGLIQLARQNCFVEQLPENGPQGVDGYYVRLTYTIMRTNAVASYTASIYR